MENSQSKLKDLPHYILEKDILNFFRKTNEENTKTKLEMRLI